jgi:hypothetical protein
MLVGLQASFLWNRLALINLALTSLSIFMLSFFEIPKGVCKRLDFWDLTRRSEGHKCKYWFPKWNIIYRQKDQDGIDAKVLYLQNKCLLRKWIFKILNGDGVWQELIQNKYLHFITIAQVKLNAFDSRFRKGLLKGWLLYSSPLPSWEWPA